MSTRVYIMFGGNIGNVEATFAEAEKYLGSHGLHFDQKSSIHPSAAVDCVPGTPDFKDQALSGIWNGSARELLELLQQTERHFGRPANHRSDMSRTLDCDIIFFGNQVVNEPDLIIPHPRMHNRLFVLEPLFEIAPDFIHPVLNRQVSQILQGYKK